MGAAPFLLGAEEDLQGIRGTGMEMKPAPGQRERGHRCRSWERLETPEVEVILPHTRLAPCLKDNNKPNNIKVFDSRG